MIRKSRIIVSGNFSFLKFFQLFWLNRCNLARNDLITRRRLAEKRVVNLNNLKWVVKDLAICRNVTTNLYSLKKVMSVLNWILRRCIGRMKQWRKIKAQRKQNVRLFEELFYNCIIDRWSREEDQPAASCAQQLTHPCN